MKKCLLILSSIIFWNFLSAQGGWRENEMEVKVSLNSASDYMLLHELKLNGDVYPGNVALMYVSPDELIRIKESGLEFEVLKEDLNSYFYDFWTNRDAYHTYDEIIQVMNSLTFGYSDICKKYDFGYSVDGRQLTALKISDNVTLDEDEPEVMFDGGIHGDEIGGAENLIRFAEDLCEGYGTDPDITDLVDNREIWLYVMVNPDGREYMTRYNAVGVDLNRDWGYMWNGEGSSTGPFSQVETKALRNCLYNNQFVVHTTFHSGTEFISYPWSYRPDPCPDDNHIDFLAALYSTTSGYPNLTYGQGYNGMYAINGSSKDSYYGIMGSVGWTIEISDDKQPPSSQIQYYYEANYPSMMMLIEHSGYGIRGMVTDAQTGDPVPALIWVDDFYPTYSDPEVGDYHKYLTAGSYSVTVTANGYEPLTQSNITVTDLGITTVDFILQPGDGYFAWRVAHCAIPDNNHDDEGRTPAALGEPDGTRYSMGKDGWIVLDMLSEVLDGPGNELKVYEGDSDAEGFTCFAGPSMDGPWTFLGTGNGTTAFDFSDVSLLEARYIRIVDDGDGPSSGDNAGFDLDAVEALEQPQVVYLLMDCTVDDAEGNNNQRIDPGESFDLLVTLRNHGGMTAENTTATLNLDTTWLNAENIFLDFGSLDHGEVVQLAVPMTADPATPLETIIMMVMNVSANAGGYHQSFPFNFTVGALVEDWESNGFEQYPWSTFGAVPWNITFINPFEGAYSAKSGNIENDQYSVLEVELDVIGYDDISFYRKVSSEPGYDFLRFYIDGIMIEQWSGSLDWELVSYDVIPGTHTFRWEYIKDEGVSYNMDCGWIDYITFPSCNLDGTLYALANAFPGEYCYPGETSLGTYVIGGTPPYSYNWDPADSLNNPNIQFPAANPSESTLYTVTVGDNSSGMTSSSVMVNVFPMPETPEITQQGDSLVSSSPEGNQWYDSQGAIEGENEPVFYPGTEGDYYVIVTSENGCSSEPSNVVYFLFTGVPETYGPEIRIYPIPVRDLLNIEGIGIVEGNYRFDLVNVTGNIIFSFNSILNNNSPVKIDASELPAGIYIISIHNLDSGDISAFKIIK